MSKTEAVVEETSTVIIDGKEVVVTGRGVPYDEVKTTSDDYEKHDMIALEDAGMARTPKDTGDGVELGGGSAPADPATVDNLGGATKVGKDVMKATDAAAARSAIGAGTPYSLPAATLTANGGVKLAAKVTDIATGAEAAAIVTAHNALLKTLRDAGILAK